MRLFYRFTALFMMILVVFTTSLGSVIPSRAAPQDDPLPPEFLRNISDLTGLIEDAQDWVVGGGFLYWSKCDLGGPNTAGEEGSINAIGYLRRWPLGGGLPAQLSGAAFCYPATAHWTADESGLYYWLGGYIYRRTVGDAATPVAVESTAEPSGNLLIDGDFIYWLVGSSIWRVPKHWNFDRDPRDEADYIGEAGSNPHNLVVDGDDLLWFGSGQLLKMNKNCLGGCTAQPLAPELGNYLAPILRLYADLTRAYPLWTAGPNIRAVSCPLGGSCASASIYTAPFDPAKDYQHGKLVSDGDFIFWVENYRPAGCTIGTPTCIPSSFGRLLKWNRQEGVATDPFNSPQPIACADCGAMYKISNFGERIFVTGGWVYFETTNGITRIRADAPPVTWDLAFAGMEVTQGVQSLLNDVPLVANKPTYVRVYGQKVSGPNVYAVGARLYGRNANGDPLPGSPLRAINGDQAFTANNTTPRRFDPQVGWLFELPPEWTASGSIRLTARVDPRQVWPDPSQSNNASPEQTFSFTHKAAVCIVTIPVRTHAPAAAKDDPSLYRMIDVLKRVSPAAEVWLFHQNNDVAQLEARIGLPPWTYEPYAIPEDEDNVLDAIEMRATFSDDPDVCDDSGAITHYVGLVHAATNTTNSDGGTALGLGNRPGDSLYIKLIDPALFGAVEWQTQQFNTLIHELGHNAGRMHVNCGNPAKPDPAFPYTSPDGLNCVFDSGLATNPATHYGFDVATLSPISPTAAADFMSYNSSYWVSDYTWKALFNSLNRGVEGGVTPEAARELAAAAEVVYLSGTVTPGQGEGQLDYAWKFPTQALSQGILEKLQDRAAPAYAPLQAHPTGGTAVIHVRLLDAGGALLDDRTVTLSEVDDGDNAQAGFTLAFPAPAGQVRRIELLEGDTVLAFLQPGASLPAITVTSPAGGETFDDAMTLSWNASDPDPADKLLFTVQYSPDNGQTWRAIVANFPNTAEQSQVTLNLEDISGLPASTSAGLVRVAVSDGYNTAFATSQPFTIPNRLPSAAILAPQPGQSIPAGQPVLLRGQAHDAEDGGITAANLQWELDGLEVGTGPQVTLESLAPGTYTVKLIARDSAGAETTVAATLTIAALSIPLGGMPEMDGVCSDDAYGGARRLLLSPYADGSQATVQLLIAGDNLWACFSGLARVSGSSPAGRVVLRADTNYGRESIVQADDYLFALVEDGTPLTYAGTGAGYVTPGPGGLVGAVSASPASWSAEMAISRGVLGGWNHVIGMDVEHAWVTAIGDDLKWPAAAHWLTPSTWAATALGPVPHLNSLSPPGAAAGLPELTLTVQGENFLSGASLQVNGINRPTTVLDSTQAQITLPAAELAQAGMVVITAVNPDLADAPSNSLPFYIGLPSRGNPSHIFLPLVVNR